MHCSISNLDEVPHVVPVPPEEARCARVVLQHEGDGAGGSPLFRSLVAVVDHFTLALMMSEGLSILEEII